MKKIVCIWLALVVLSVFVGAVPFAAAADTVVTVSTAEELDAIRENLSGKYRLVKDIDLSGLSWKPIGETTTTPFTGSLDGGGHTLYGLTVTMSDLGEKTAYAGLFGFFKGSVENLKFYGASITIDGAKSVRAGVVAASNQGSISGVSATGAIVSKNVTNIASVGGIAGRQTNTGTIDLCRSAVDLKSDGVSVRVGGIVAENLGGAVSCCEASGYLEIDKARDKATIGGIVGENQNVNASGECIASVNDVLFSGDLYGYAENETRGGGIIGLNSSGQLTGAVMQGTLNLDSDSHNYNGLFIGDNDGQASDLLYQADDSGLSPVGAGATVSVTAFTDSATAAQAKPLTDSGNWTLSGGKLAIKGLPALANKPSIPTSKTTKTTTMAHKTTTTTKKTTNDGSVVTTTTTGTRKGGEMVEDASDFTENDAPTAPPKNESRQTSPWLFVAIGAAILLLGAGVWVLLKKRK